MRKYSPLADPDLAELDSPELDLNTVTTENDKERTQRTLDKKFLWAVLRDRPSNNKNHSGIHSSISCLELSVCLLAF